MCLVDSVYTFTASAFDSDGDSVQFMFSWGDGTGTDWCDGTASHAWATSDTYVVTCRARDAGGLLSDSTTIRITVLKGSLIYIVGDDSMYEAARCAQETRDGGFVVTGWATRDSSCYLCLVKVDVAGRTEWFRTFSGPGYSKGYSVIQTEDGGYVAVGYTDLPTGSGSSMYVVRTDAHGDSLWTRTYDDYYCGNSVVLRDDGDYLVAAASIAGRAVIISLTPDGTSRDVKDITAGGVFSLVNTGDDSLIATGWATEPRGLLVTRAGSSGEVAWTRTVWPGEEWGVGTSACTSPTGGYALAVTPNGIGHLGIVRVDGKGDPLWTTLLNYGAGIPLHPYSVLSETDGGFTIAGGAPGTLLRTDASGYPTRTTVFGNVGFYSLTECSDGTGLLAGDIANGYLTAWNILVIRIAR